MREKLLCEWKQKYERLNRELGKNERQLQTLEKRKKDLVIDIYIQIVYALLCLVVSLFIISWWEEISYFFQPFFIMATAGLMVAALIYNGYQFFRRIKRWIHHTRKIDPIEYPKLEMVQSNYALHPQPNYYAEGQCIEWLIRQYTDQMLKMTELRRRIEKASEQECDILRKELDEIVFYESVGCARL